uniref:Uncharacterized protein n=1 Tax=viral metagenome TaxID=1070528 RepID=A0A6C0AKK3_9ZZZZ
MKLSKKTESTIKFLLKTNKNKKSKLPNINSIIKSFHKEIIISEKHVKLIIPTIKKQIKTIGNIGKISTLIHFSPKRIKEQIINQHNKLLSYEIILLNKKIIINCLLEEKDLNYIYKYENMISIMLIWLKFVFSYTKNNTLSKLTINIALTDYLKELPTNNLKILDDMNCNTGSTYACKKDTEIFIYRKEEWFKVFIHETFHSLCLDFSMMNVKDFNKKINTLFPIDSKFNLYEAYSEFWAEIFNILFCSYFTIEQKNDYKEFKMFFDFFLYNEKLHSLFQCSKILDFYNLKYENLYKKDEISNLARKQYKENTNVFAYYFIKSILLFNAEKFMKWCDKNQINILIFSKNTRHLNKFFKFIKHHYKENDFIKNINNLQIKHNEIINNDFLSNNLRMTVCELEL